MSHKIFLNDIQPPNKLEQSTSKDNNLITWIIILTLILIAAWLLK